MTQDQPSTQQNILAGAGFGIRAGARIIDTVYGLILGFIGGMFSAFILLFLQHSSTVSAGWQSRVKGFDIWIVTLSFLGTILYHLFSEGIYGASL